MCHASQIKATLSGLLFFTSNNSAIISTPPSPQEKSTGWTSNGNVLINVAKHKHLQLHSNLEFNQIIADKASGAVMQIEHHILP